MVQKNIQKNIAPSNFRFLIKRLPNTAWDVQQVSLPQISLGTAIQATYLKNISHPGEKIEYSQLDVTFIVDENLENYFEIKNWIEGVGFPIDTKQFAEIETSYDGLYSDISVYLLSNTNNANIELMFTRAFPVALSGFVMSTSDSAENVITATVSFDFTSYKTRLVNTSL